MRLYGGPSPKRHVAYSSSPWIERFNVGRLRGWKPSDNTKKNVAVWVDKATGKKKYHGTKHLKSTESFPQPYLFFQNQMFIVLMDGTYRYYSVVCPNATARPREVLPTTFWIEGCGPHAASFGGLPGAGMPT